MSDPTRPARLDDQPPRAVLQSLEQFAEKPPGRLAVTTALHQDIEHVTVLINGLPSGVLRPPSLLQPPLMQLDPRFRTAGERPRQRAEAGLPDSMQRELVKLVEREVHPAGEYALDP